MDDVPSDAFISNPDGSWSSIRYATLPGLIGIIEIRPGMVFRKGEEYLGIDVAALLDEHSRSAE